ncbi:hypothetical protein [Alteromonas sp. KUL49]|uniref:hypothetical protein n=1 Tax=Alteromonas sp. KUL49 TaxID=2480798 RepID=UPI00102EE816|nr:hypothetical protein [Alteromonas sp. KUL49]TAP40353.1 hypothetical protein EYS00_09345 [Alteromonas sp. KUL49]GEA11503.1 hypothetical protein KUL49_18780 [Alteromonas sp. KUL49]
MVTNPLTKSIAAVLLLGLSNLVLAQQTEEPIRLEVTIKGSKEQPQVLSIVPWQLPEHRSIDGTLTWPLKAMELSLIERKSFMRNLALTQHMGQVNSANHSAGEAQQ